MVILKLEPRFSPFQMPCVIIGTIVNEKPNFMCVTWVNRVNRTPPLYMVSINKTHYTLEGIKKNKVFSINFPSCDLVKKVDYIGITSGKHVDKSKVFDIFYGIIKAPLIEECPLTIELSLTNLIELPDHYMVIGTAVNTYFNEEYLTDGLPDFKKMNLIIYTGIKNKQAYWSIGEKLADAFKIGKELKE
ncbi:MAG: flavin reductase family protein [Candidatus Hodarchaeales archaeon]|jgi:flavin reductase (DIM6/NTAB) family NADH-FMN oxidoreductase RutF